MAVAWNDNANNEAGYYVDRTTDNQNWARVASLGADQSGYLDQGLARLSQYGYRLTAWNSFGESQPVTITVQTGFSEGEPTGVEGGTITPNTEISGTTTIITYTYDSLFRLTAADYASGIFYHYSYDSVGNRLSEEKVGVTTNYTYTNNKLSSITNLGNNQQITYQQYNGLGALVSQMIDGVM